MKSRLDKSCGDLIILIQPNTETLLVVLRMDLLNFGKYHKLARMVWLKFNKKWKVKGISYVQYIELNITH
jgi:hypothetical protein